jgi:hypothetical protein
VSPREAGAAQAAVVGERARAHVRGVQRALLVAQLADVELPVDRRRRVVPAEERVTGRLHDALAVNHALAL